MLRSHPRATGQPLAPKPCPCHGAKGPGWCGAVGFAPPQPQPVGSSGARWWLQARGLCWEQGQRAPVLPVTSWEEGEREAGATPNPPQHPKTQLTCLPPSRALPAPQPGGGSTAPGPPSWDLQAIKGAEQLRLLAWVPFKMRNLSPGLGDFVSLEAGAGRK